GLERLVSLMDAPEPQAAPAYFIAALGGAAHREALRLAEALRAGGVAVEMDHSDRSLKAQLKRADRLGARRVVILGEEELTRGEAPVRDLAARRQEAYPLEGLADRLIQEASS
ncbi:MAG: histidine--tRNA ligase, partial [Nitrospirae bacterium]